MNLLYLLKPKENTVFLSSEQTVRQGLEKMKVHGYTAVPVIDKEGRYIGTVNEGDFLWALCGEGSVHSLEHMNITKIIREKRDKAVLVSADMEELLLMIMEQNFVPVTDDRGIFIGIVTRRDIIKYFYEKEHDKCTKK